MTTITLNIPFDHPAFAGHFPGMPITPGVVLLDLAMLAIAQHRQREIQPCKIRTLKFLSPVLPDTHLRVQYEITSNGSLQFEIRNGTQLAVTGVIDE
tara:strand:+ start:908769 stop:909059 length:291 start_codon:yes stop_codon:yes gene_type:complete